MGCVLILLSFHAWFVSEGGRWGWIKIVLPLSVPHWALSLSHCTFLPGRQTVKTPSQKDVLSFVPWNTACVCVTRDRIFKCLFLSPWHFSVWISPSPPAKNKRLHFRPFGKWTDPCVSSSPGALNGFLSSTGEMCSHSPFTPEPNHSLKWKLFFVEAKERLVHSGCRFRPLQAKSNILTFSFIPSASNLLSCNSSTPRAKLRLRQSLNLLLLFSYKFPFKKKSIKSW